jgi:hypothetical protein
LGKLEMLLWAIAAGLAMFLIAYQFDPDWIDGWIG